MTKIKALETCSLISRFILIGLVALVAITFILRELPIPFFEENSTTLIMPTRDSQWAVAKALTEVIGKPTAILDTDNVERFLFKDGTSVDYVIEPIDDPNNPRDDLMYNILALKTIVLDFFDFFTTPFEKAAKIANALGDRGYITQIIYQPDKAFPTGSVVLILSNAFIMDCPNMMKEIETSKNCYGAAILIRKHAFRVGGQKPKMGSPF